MKLCCAVITRNSPVQLERTLSTMTSSNIPIVVSDDSDEELATKTELVVETQGALYRMGPCKGPVANRYSVADYISQLGNYTHILFLDDDITVEHRQLSSIVRATEREPYYVHCVTYREGDTGVIVRPTVTDWKGVRRKPAPVVGGSGLSDACMVWPISAINSVEWDFAIRYGYAEAWLGAQARAKGYPIRINTSIVVIHREPNRGQRRVDFNELEAARIYYNYLIKRLEHGTGTATVVLCLDGLVTNLLRLVRGRRWSWGPYVTATKLLIKRWAEFDSPGAG